MPDSPDVSGLNTPSDSPARSGIWSLPCVMPDGSTPCIAVDSDGVLVGAYFLPPDGDEQKARAILTKMLDHDEGRRRHLTLI